MVGRNLRFGLLAGACGAMLALQVPAASAEAAGDTGTAFELAFWQAVAASNDPVLYEAYLKQYPRGTFAAIAQVKAAGQRVESTPAAPPSAGVAPEAAPKSVPGTGLLPNLPVPLPAPQFGQASLAASALASTPEAAMALRDVAAAQRTAHAAQAAAAAAVLAAAAQAAPALAAPIAADSSVVTALAAPSAPVAAPAFAFAPAAPATPAIPVQDMFGAAAAMPVASAALLASLTSDAEASPAPAPFVAPLPAPIAPPTMLASLGAAPTVLPTAAALAAAVAAQATPASLAHVDAPVAPPALVARQAAARQNAASPRYAAAAFAARPRSRRADMTAQFTRAVASTAAVSVEMPDAARQISPLGLMLGQLVRTQETPGAQYGLQEALTMPVRPQLMAMPEVALPRSFCSADQRGAFDEGIYRPALAIAEHNAEAAGAYVRKLRTLYDNSQLSGDSTAQAAIAAEARDFARTANAASSIHNALVNQFEDIMTTPIYSCGAIQ